jgi:(p)ppGpp synthase/HD superfamily hydrolase
MTGDLLLPKAVAFAMKAHGAQRYGPLPYAFHLAAVEGVLRRFGFHSDEMISAAWLHDTLEDTATTAADLWWLGPSLLGVVEAVTNEPGKNRKERAARTYPKIRASVAATALKLADRIANVEAGVLRADAGQGLLEMYRREHISFGVALRYEDPALDPMWAHLDSLLAAPSDTEGR